MDEYNFKICQEESGKRVDILVFEFVKENNLALSRTSVQKIIAEGKLTVNSEVVLKSHYKVKTDDNIKFSVEEKKIGNICPEEIPLEVVFEDEDLAIINKQIGLVVHPAPGNYEHTLVNALLHRFKKLSNVDPKRPGIVHRLDKDTSGLLVIAKNNAAHLSLSKQFQEHSIKRLYIALVKGKVQFDEHVIELPIGRHPQKRESMAVSFAANTRYAKTLYRTLKRKRDFSLIELEPFTGRTHQLRVHLASIGHPILGDSKYGQVSNFKRLALHAKYLGFIHPRSGKYIEFSTGIPKEFIEFIDITP